MIAAEGPQRPLPNCIAVFWAPKMETGIATKRERGKGGGWKGRRQLTITTSRAPVNEPLFKRGEQVLLVSWHPEDRWHGRTHPSWKRNPTPRSVTRLWKTRRPDSTPGNRRRRPVDAPSRSLSRRRVSSGGPARGSLAKTRRARRILRPRFCGTHFFRF